jgi:hypothetical protein
LFTRLASQLFDAFAMAGDLEFEALASQIHQGNLISHQNFLSHT